MEQNRLKIFLNNYFGDKAFYKAFLAVALPIMIQLFITNFVNMLDNIMVGRVGTEQMSGVAISNQLIFVFNLCIFGATAGVGIFMAQYYGDKDYDGMRHAIRFIIIVCLLLLVVSIAIFCIFGETLIKQFLHGSDVKGDLQATLSYGKVYLAVILIGLPPFVVSQSYSGALRASKQTFLPMLAGLIAVAVNLLLNYVLIYGKLGAPVLGVKGAAIATVVSRYVEMCLLLIWTHTHYDKVPYFKGVYRHFKIPFKDAKQYFIKGFPIFANELLWSLGITMLVQSYSVRGINVIAAGNINFTLSDIFNAGSIALGNAVGIVVGNLLGGGKIPEAKSTSKKTIMFSVLFSIGLGLILAICAKFFPLLYNTNDEVKDLATKFIMMTAIFMPLTAFINATYFTIRAGGKTYITFLFDCVFMWVVAVPLAYVLSRYTELDISVVFLLVLAADIVKGIIGFILLKSGIWCKKIVGDLSQY